MSPGETALTQGDYAKAETLLREEARAPGPDSERLHNALIRTLLRAAKLDEATTDAQSWQAAAPGNGWARVSVAEVEWRRGEVDKSIQDIDAAYRALPCNPRIRSDYAQMFSFSGMDAVAKRDLDMAHKLDPVDDDITSSWLALQPRSVQLDNLTAYLATSASLSPKQRDSLEREKTRLASPEPAAPCRLSTAVSSTAQPYRRIQDGPHAPIYWGLDVAFNGIPRRLEIDTGAHGLLLTRAAANAMHLSIETRGMVGGIGDEGGVSSHISRVSSIKIGALEFQDCRVEILEKDPPMGSGDGLIGGDVFADFLLTLDFPGHAMRLDPLPAAPGTTAQSNVPSLDTDSNEKHIARDRYIDPSMQNWQKVFRSGHMLILPVIVNEGPTRLFIMDTGAEMNLISWKLAKQVGKIYKGSDTGVVGLSGQVKDTYTTGPLKLDFAGMRYPSPGMVAVDTGSFGMNVGVEMAGFIGAPMLHQLTVQIDYRDDLVHFKFDPTRLQHCVEGVNLSDCY